MNNLITQFFTVDHNRLDQLFIAFQQNKGENAQLARAFFAKFKQGLLQHIEWEESLLFPEFELATGMTSGGPTFVMRSEHVEIKQLLQQIEKKLLNEEDTSSLELMLEQLMEDHNEKEEHSIPTLIALSLLSESITYCSTYNIIH